MKIYESFNSKFTTYKNLEEKFNSMKTNFDKKERLNDYDPQKFMKNPKIEENFENRKFSLVNYRKSVHNRSKSQHKNQNNKNNIPLNNDILYNNNDNIQLTPQEKFFKQEITLDKTSGNKQNLQNQKDGFFFEDDNAFNDFNKIDNNFSNLNVKDKEINKNKNNPKTNIPIPNFSNLNNDIPYANDNQFNHTPNFAKINNNINNSGLNNKYNIGNSINNPIKLNENKNSYNYSFKAIDDFNEIFGNQNLNNINDNFGNQFSKNNNDFDLNFNNQAKFVLETQNDFGNPNSYNLYRENYNNRPKNYDFNQIDNNIISNISNFNNLQANPGHNNIGKFTFSIVILI